MKKVSSVIFAFIMLLFSFVGMGKVYADSTSTAITPFATVMPTYPGTSLTVKTGDILVTDATSPSASGGGIVGHAAIVVMSSILQVQEKL